MLLGHSLPSNWTYGLSSGEFLTAPELLHDRAPAERVVLAWDDGAQSSATTVDLTATRSAAVVPRIGALLGSDLPVGLKIEVRGKRAEDAGFTYDLGGNALTQTLGRLPGGRVGCWWAFDADLDPIVAYQVRLYNDVGGSDVLTAEQELRIGQLIIAPAVNIPHQTGPLVSWVDPSPIRRTLGAQTQRVARRAYRELSLQGCLDHSDLAWGGGLPGGLDWQTVLDALAADPYTCLAPYWDGVPGDLQATALFGICSNLGIEGLAGPYRVLERMTLSEVPG